MRVVRSKIVVNTLQLGLQLSRKNWQYLLNWRTLLSSNSILLWLQMRSWRVIVMLCLMLSWIMKAVVVNSLNSWGRAQQIWSSRLFQRLKMASLTELMVSFHGSELKLAFWSHQLHLQHKHRWLKEWLHQRLWNLWRKVGTKDQVQALPNQIKQLLLQLQQNHKPHPCPHPRQLLSNLRHQSTQALLLQNTSLQLRMLKSVRKCYLLNIANKSRKIRQLCSNVQQHAHSVVHIRLLILTPTMLLLLRKRSSTLGLTRRKALRRLWV